MESRDAAIEFKNVTKRYEGNAGNAPALNEVDLTVRQGEFLAITGKSGCGKSTLLNLATGIDGPTSGLVRISGEDLGGMGETAKASLRARKIGIVFQFFQLVPTLRAVENVMLPMSFSKAVPRAARRKRAIGLLSKIGLAERAGHFPAQLSGGEQQRVAIARALANDPSIIVADEPTGNLDSATAGDVLRILRGLSEEGKTVLIVSHDRDVASNADRLVTMADGRITG
jgi:putative ABC transport system ATP-binding protein